MFLEENETKIRKILQHFVSGTIPEYILEMAQEAVPEESIIKTTVDANDSSWEVTALVQGEDFQNYSPKISIDLTEETIKADCNCQEFFTDACKHVAALASKFLANFNLETAQEVTANKQHNWRQTFREYFTSEPEPESGKHYIIFRLYPEAGRLQVAFFRARQNKSGISQVQNEISLAQLVDNPDWCELSPKLPEVAEQIGHYLDYRGHRVELPPGLHSWFFRVIKNEHYTYLRDSDQPVSIVRKPMQLRLSPKLNEDGLYFDILLNREDTPPFSIQSKEEIYFYGRLPLWLYWKNTFYPVQTGLEPQLVQEMVEQQPVVPHAEISEFLDRVWTQIPVSDLYGHEDFLERMGSIFVKAEFNPKLFLDEEGSLLTLKIQNIYETEDGEFPLMGPTPELQTGSYRANGKSYLIRRAQDEETQLMAELTDMGFTARNNHTWFMEQEEAINFLLDYYPALVDAYRVYGEQNLTRYKVRLSQPQVVAEIETDEENKWFNLDLAVEYDDQRVPIDEMFGANYAVYLQ